MDITITITEQLHALVLSKVESGLYESPSEVVREALRLMEERDRLRSAKIDGMRDDARLSLAGEAGEAGQGRRARRAAAQQAQ